MNADVRDRGGASAMRGPDSRLLQRFVASVKSAIEWPLFFLPRLHSAALIRRPVVDLNKLAWVATVRRGQAVLDIGANRGYYTRFLSREVGGAGRVYAFEPVPASAKTLRASCAMRPNVSVFEVALSDEIGRRRIFVPGNDLQQASLAMHAGGSWKGCDRISEHEIDTITLDAWAGVQALAKLDFIKIDVEGAEYKVLLGGASTIRKFRPLIYMEICRDWLREFGYEPGDLERLLREFGYAHIYQPQISGGRFRLAPVSLLDMEIGDVLVTTQPI